MYESFFGLKERPFSLTPNPRYVYFTPQYREAEDRIEYGIAQREGFMVLTGVPGCGKTTLCRDLIEKLDPRTHQTALIFNPFLGGLEMLQALLSEYGMSYSPTANRKELLDKLNSFFMSQLVLGRSCLAIFDEAQHLSTEFLEQIRVLSNLETDREKLVHIVLVGQPELLDRIRAPGLAQLDQRVSIRCTLGPLSPEETDRYIHHRLNVAGAQGRIRFSPRALRAVQKASGGVPRLINLICDRSLLAAFTDETFRISHAHVAKAVQLLGGEEPEMAGAGAQRWDIRRWALVTAAILTPLIGGLLLAAKLGALPIDANWRPW